MVEIIEKSSMYGLLGMEDSEISLDDIINLDNISENPKDLSDKIPAVVAYMHWYFPSWYVLPEDDKDLLKFAESIKNELGKGYRKNNRRIKKIMRELRPKLNQRISEDLENWPDLTEYGKERKEEREMQEYRNMRRKLHKMGLGPVTKQIEIWYQIVCSTYVDNMYGYSFLEAVDKAFCKGKKE